MNNQILIVIEGGKIQHIKTNMNVDILVVDTDNIRQGGDTKGDLRCPDLIDKGRDVFENFRKPEPLTKEQEYLDNPNYCPVCGSRNIESDRILVGDDDNPTAEVHCEDCKAEWTDEYTLTKVTINK